MWAQKWKLLLSRHLAPIVYCRLVLPLGNPRPLLLLVATNNIMISAAGIWAAPCNDVLIIIVW